ncbi:MAG: hypothetical protein GQ570_06790 [Helicobacteraceae bacterium]|nr:hypothetical protein [Helicobacteraceae bacterium]
MALIKCKECEKEYSDNSEACPQCGCPTEMNVDTPQIDTSDIKCSVRIDGNEKLSDTYNGLMFLLLFVAGLISIPYVLFGSYTGLFPFIVLLIIFLFRNSITSKKRVKAMEIFKFFKLKYPILESVGRNTNLDQITTTSNNADGALFDIYMQAYKKQADAVVINSTHSSSTESISKMSKNTPLYHATATLVKYKK